MTDQTRITVSEDTLRRILAEFKLELLEELKNYVSVTAHAALESRVKILELWQAGVLGQTTARRQVSAGTLAWATLAVGAITALASMIWLTHG